MAAPAFGSKGTHRTGSTASPQFAVPSGVVSGDIIVIPMYLDGATTITAMATDFDHAEGSPVSVTGSGAHSLAVVWKRASAADTGTYDFTLSGANYSEGSAIRYTGAAASGSPWDSPTNTAQTTGVNGTVSPSVSVTTAGINRLLVWAASNWSGGSWTPPTGFSERMDSGAGIHTLADMAQAAAGSSGSVTGTCTGNDKRCAWLGALIPAALTQALGIATETDTAMPLGRSKQRVLGVAEETDSALSLDGDEAGPASPMTVSTSQLTVVVQTGGGVL